MCLIEGTWDFVTSSCGTGLRKYLNLESRQNNSPKPLKIAQKAIILHTLGVQVFARRHGLSNEKPEGGGLALDSVMVITGASSIGATLVGTWTFEEFQVVRTQSS